MASRRTRIKGIANIPQRRKPTTNAEETTKNESEVKEQPKLINEQQTEVKEEKEPPNHTFIKPVARKLDEAEEPKVTNSTPNRNKIVILNEVITYSNQSQPLLIQNNSPNHSVIHANENGINSRLPQGSHKNNTLDKDIKRLAPPATFQQIPDLDYPIPPPSPSKINRSRIKAVPRLGQRNTSFSASESEDETRRNYRHRNDSLSSSTSGIQDATSIPECLSPQKPREREFNSVIQRKCRRTEQSRKLAEARRDFYLKFGNKKPDRQKLTMIDLIFYNPVTNPMSNDTKPKRKVSEAAEPEEPKEVEEEKKDESDEENEIPAPQIKVGPQGEIIVDEQSLVIENKALKKNREELEKSQVVNGDFDTGYGVYKRAKRSKDWSKQETLKFYKALNTIGTDFTLMCELFPRRSRRELKMKFKKEERVNKALIDKAIMQPTGYDFDDFKHEVDMEEKELQEMEKQQEREKVLKMEAKKRKLNASPAEEIKEPKRAKLKKKRPLDIMGVLEDDSDADESEVESLVDEEKTVFAPKLPKPTRSGRVPRLADRFRAPEEDNKAGKPGSLIVVAETGPNGQPVYKVCMVTGDNARQQIGDSVSSLEKALESKENGLTSLFTLTATAAEKDEGNEIENNVTIPAELEI